ncbi:MAG: CehA/McbA family metallohydrolase [Pseudomonadota bacterium]
MALFAAAVLLASCSNGGSAMKPDFSGAPDTAFTIHDEKDLIGGPMAQGRTGDVLLKNDRIRVVIQKPRKNPGVNSFGGNIIDADLVRPGGAPGQDNFGTLFPLVNVEWTVDYYNFEVVSDGSGGGPKVLRAYGKIDVYDYLDLSFIQNVSEGLIGQKLTYANRFDDRMDPFDIYGDLKGVSPDVITDYTLEPGKNYVRIDTKFTNSGDTEVKLPMGEFINGSGQGSMLIPGQGFSPDLMAQAGSNTPAIIYAAFDGVDASYGYFFKAGQFIDPKKGDPYTTTSITYSGVTGLLMGEEFLKIAPLGMGGTPDIHFSIPPDSERTITGYFVVGNGSAGSVLDAGLSAIGADARPVSGVVKSSDGKPFANAIVAIQSRGQTLITYRTDSQGRFTGNLPTGGDPESKRFGNGRYTVAVDVPGYQLNGTSGAGKCEPAEIDVFTQKSATVECTLGETGRVEISGPVVDAATGKALPARLTIIGEDPSPNKVGSAGRFRSSIEWEQPFGIADVKYITAKGTFDLTGEKSFNIEPGTYRFVISHGQEYSSDEKVIEVTAGGMPLLLSLVKLSRVSPTPGYISADFHIHSIRSPDSTLPQEMRVLSAAAEGLDVLQASDHDYVTDYAPVLARLVADGLIPAGSMQTSSGEEITPNHYGHLHVFPVTAKADDPDGGAIDWSASPRNEVSFAPHYVLTLDELTDKMRSGPGDEVVQIDHIMDSPTGIITACGWVTSSFYAKDFGVPPLSSYADPVERRMPPRSDGGISFPIPLGGSGLVTTNFDSVELVVGPHLHDNSLLFRSALPTWFNLLNLGLIVTATADSDSHMIRPEPVGMPRNYVLSSVDPNDGKGANHSAIDLQEYAANIRAHRLTVSAGPIVLVHAKSDSGSAAEIGGTVTGKHVTFTVDVKAPSWGWFDTIEIYANTEPMPVDDKTDTPMKGTAADPAEFYKPYHVPRYTYEPVKSFRLADGTLESWKEEKGSITATVAFDMDFDEDTWVVAMVRGTQSTKGYRSLFPLVTRALIDDKARPESFDPANLAAFNADKRVGAQGWALANPIFVDVDGDGFKAKYVRSGVSPLK